LHLCPALDHSHPPLAGTKRWRATGQAVFGVMVEMARAVIGTGTDSRQTVAAIAGRLRQNIEAVARMQKMLAQQPG
jgi:hypothetical protein